MWEGRRSGQRSPQLLLLYLWRGLIFPACLQAMWKQECVVLLREQYRH